MMIAGEIIALDFGSSTTRTFLFLHKKQSFNNDWIKPSPIIEAQYRHTKNRTKIFYFLRPLIRKQDKIDQQ